MSDLNARLNSTNLTLQDFKNIAEHSKADAEVRIKKSDGKLSTTPLGFIARNIGLTHKESNNQATLAFWTVLINSDKYRDVSDSLRHVMNTKFQNGSIKAGKALTPAKINEAIKIADNLLSVHQKTKAATENIVSKAKDFGLVPQSQVQALKNFAESFVFNDLTIKSSFTELDKKGKTVDSIVNKNNDLIKKVLTEFYSSKNPDYFAAAQNEFTFKSGLVGDETKAKFYSDLLKDLNPGLKGDFGRGLVLKAIDNCNFDADTSTYTQEPVLKDVFVRAVHLHGSDGTLPFKGLLKLDTDQVNMLANAVKTVVSDKDKCVDGLNVMLAVLMQATEKFPELLDGNSNEVSDNVNRLLDRFCKNVSENKHVNSIILYKEVRQLKIDLFKESLASNVEISQFCAEKGISKRAMEALLSDKEFRSELVTYMTTLEKEDIESGLTAKLKDYAEANMALLRKFENTQMKESLAGATYGAAKYVDLLLNELSKDNPDGVAVLDNVKSILNKARSEEVSSDADAAEVIRTAIQTMLSSLDPQVKDKVMSEKNQKLLLSMYTELNFVMQNDKSLTADDKKNINSIAELLFAVNTNLTAELPDDKIVDPFSVKTDLINSALKENALQPAQGNKSVPRNATEAEIFNLQQQIMNNPGLVEKRDDALPIIKNTKCTDLNFIQHFMNINSPFDSILNVFKENQPDSTVGLLENLVTIGENIEKMGKALPDYKQEDIVKFLFDAVINTSTPEQLQKMKTALSNPLTKQFLEVLNTQQAKEKSANKEAFDPTFAESGKRQVAVDNILKNINLLDEMVSNKLGLEKPGPVFDPEVKRSPDEFSYQTNLPGKLSELFPLTYNDFDHTLMGNDDISLEQKAVVRDFVSNFKVPVDGKATLKNVGAFNPEKEFEYTFINNDGEEETGEWSVKEFLFLMGSHATEISKLLEDTGGKPTAQQLWAIVHGGNPPAELTLDNFAEKVTLAIHNEVRAFGNLMGKDFDPPTFVWLGREAGLAPDQLVKKFASGEKGEIVFKLSEQKGGRGFFAKKEIGGLRFAANNGAKDHYGFSVDFYRAKNPEGVTSNEYCKLTVHTSDNKEIVITDRQYKDLKTPVEKAKFEKDVPNKVREGLGGVTEEQLGGIGWCCTQCIGVQSLLRFCPNFYYIPSLPFEHTALNHSVKKLENGNVQVTVTEKPGTAFFKCKMVFEITPNGIINNTEGEIRIASMEQFKNYKKEHPEVRF